MPRTISRLTLDAEPPSPAGEPPRVTPDDPAASAFLSALAMGRQSLEELEPAARRGEVEGVHRLRTTTRRLRTLLKLFADLSVPEWGAALQADLKRLARRLGDVRDLDVLADRLAAEAEAASISVAALGPLFASFGERHAKASEALAEELKGDLYLGVLARLSTAAGDVTPSADARRPCSEVLPGLVRRVWKHLRRSGRALTAESPDEDFHEVRKRAKRARYAADAVAGALEPGPAAAACRFSRRAKAVQDVLGAHQDAVVAARELRESAAVHPELGPFNFAAGQLLAREERVAADTRGRFFDAWGKLDRKKVVHWLEH